MGAGTGTITSATPSVDLMTALDTQFTTNGWTFIETFTSSTNVTNIYKSPGTSNSFGTDFFVGMNRTSTTSSVAFMLFEIWDATGKKCRKYAPNGSNTAPDTDYSIVDATGLAPNAMNVKATIPVATSTTFTWWSSITADRAMFTSSVSTTSGGYVGLFDSFLQNDPFPICVLNWSGTLAPGTGYGAVTREPLQTAAAANNFAAQISSVMLDVGYNYTGAVYGAPDVSNKGFANWIYSSTNRVAQRVMFFSSRSQGGGLRGVLKDAVVSSCGSVQGDTLSYTVGATTYGFVRAGSGTLNSIWMPTF